MNGNRRYVIGAGQAFAMLFVTRSVIMLTLNSRLAGGSNFMDNIFSALLALVLNFVFILPLYALYKRSGGKDILEMCGALAGKWSKLLALFYILYFALVNCYYLSFFLLFITNVLEPLTPVWLAALALLAAACYAGYMGLEAVARTSLLVLAVVCVGSLWLGGALLSNIRPIHFDPFFYEGPRQALTGCALFLARSTGFATLALLLPRIRGRKKKGFAIWNVSVYLLMALVIFGMVGAGGEYLKTQLFPVFSASTFAYAGAWERLDAMFITIWIGGLFIKLALDACLLRQCAVHVSRGKASHCLTGFALVAVGAVSLLIARTQWLQEIFYGVWLLLPLTAMAGVGFPALLLLVDVVKKRRAKKGGGRA